MTEVQTRPLTAVQCGVYLHRKERSVSGETENRAAVKALKLEVGAGGWDGRGGYDRGGLSKSSSRRQCSLSFIGGWQRDGDEVFQVVG